MRFRNASGQAAVEFALVSVVLVLLVAGAIEFGQLYAAKIDLAGGARAGARWAATHPNAWTNNATPATNTIEGQVQSAGGTSATLPNTDAAISIEYFAYSGGVSTLCGHYTQATNVFTALNGYTQANCLIPGTLIRVTVSTALTGPANAFGRLFPAVTVKAQATMPELS
jgi:Flp pilus assembly protein TadG